MAGPMAESSSGKRRRITDEGGAQKALRSNVAFEMLNNTTTGVASIFKYEYQADCDTTPKNYAELRSEIDKSPDILRIQGQAVYLYTAFRVALKKIITYMEESQTEAAAEKAPTTKRIVLLHGAPGIGKSTLARVLTYYLCHIYQRGFIVRYTYSSSSDSDNLVERPMSMVLSAGSKVVVLDQCNTDQLDESMLLSFWSDVERREYPPIVMFTSGHCFPKKLWWNSQNVCSKIIHLQLGPQDLEPSSAFVVNNCPHLSKTILLKALELIPLYSLFRRFTFKAKVDIKLDEVERFVNEQQKEDLEHLLSTNKFKLFVYHMWYSLLIGDVIAYCDVDRDYFRLTPENYQLLLSLSRWPKDISDTGKNGLLNWIIPRKREVPGAATPAANTQQQELELEANGDFSEMEFNDASFWMLHQKAIYDQVIMPFHSTSISRVKDMYTTSYAQYNSQ